MIPVHEARDLGQVLEIGAGTGLLTNKLLKTFHIHSLYLNDLVPEMKAPLSRICDGFHVEKYFAIGDAETIDFQPGNDLVVSSSTIQWFNNTGAFFAKLPSLVKPGGLVALSSFAPGNMHQVKQVTNQGLDYLSLEHILSLVPPCFSVVSAGEESIDMFFESPTEILRHLKSTGVNGLSPRHWTRSSIVAFSENYAKFYQHGRGYCLTYKPLYVVLRLELRGK
jgi:malonyl-ACP O-methyltransferase BioC